MIPRTAADTLRTMARGFPVLALTGPRQSGKTTLARSVFAHLPYVNLEDLDTRELALAEHWYADTALEDLLGVTVEQIQLVLPQQLF